MRGVTIVTNDGYTGELISTRTPHAGSDQVLDVLSDRGGISTRTPHAGSDVCSLDAFVHVSAISTRTPHAGSD